MFKVSRKLLSTSLKRYASTLILVEHNGVDVNPATLNTVTAAKKLGGPIHALVVGDSCQEVSTFTVIFPINVLLCYLIF